MTAISSEDTLKISDFLWVIIIFTISRIPFLSPDSMIFSVDMYWFAGAIGDYDLNSFHPHLPGYYLYVKLLEVINLGGLSLKASAHIINVFAQFTSTILFYRSIERSINSKIGLYLTIALILNPACWLYGIVGETYSFDLLAGTAMLFIWTRPKYWYLIFPLLALLSGFRQSIGALLLPSAIYLVYKNYKQVKIPHIVLSIVSGVMIFLLWFLPMINSAGGLFEYIQLYKTHSPHRYLGVINNLTNFVSYAIWWAPPIIILIGIALWKKAMSSNLKFILVSSLFPILFFTFYHYSKGYILLILPFLYFLIVDLEKKYLVIAIITSGLVFLIPSFSFPDYEINMVKDYRGNSSIENAIGRANSITNTTYSAVYNKYYIFNEYHDLIQSNSGKNIVFDPSNYIYPGELAYFYPEKRIYKFELNDENHKIGLFYQWYNTIEKLEKNLLNDAVFIGRQGYVNEYLQSYTEIIESTKNLSSYKILNDSINLYYEMMYRLHRGYLPKEPLIP